MRRHTFLEPSLRRVQNRGGQVTNGSNPIVGATVVEFQAGATPDADAIQLGSRTTDNHGGFNVSLSPMPANGAIAYFAGNGGNAGLIGISDFFRKPCYMTADRCTVLSRS